MKVFRERLAELGYTEGRNLAIEYRYSDDDPRKLGRLAMDLERAGVAVIYAPGAPSALAAKSVIRKIPIVFSAVNDPVIVKLVESYARPGGNVTGVATDVNVLGGKRLELLKEALPGVQRVALLFDLFSAEACRLELDQIKDAAKKLGLALEPIAFQGNSGLDLALERVRSAKVQALASPVEGNYGVVDIGKIVSFAANERLPSMIEPSQAAEQGALLSYAPDYDWATRRSADYVVRILKGASPAMLPVERPTEFDLVVNLRTAKALGIKVPPSLLLRAKRLIE